MHAGNGAEAPTPRSSAEGIAWPAAMGGQGAALLAMQYQLDRTQWWPPEVLRRHQFRQLEALLRHADAAVPYYRRALAEAGVDPAAGLTEAAWSRIPLLTRRTLQEQGEALRARRVPKGHGRVHRVFTSGSTGAPVRALGSDLTGFFWLALTLRDKHWHRFDVTGKLAAIRHDRAGRGAYPEGIVGTGWGKATESVYATGPAALLEIRTPIHQQVEWLRRQDPDYLTTYPTNLAALLAHCRDHGVRLPRLRLVETLAEVLQPEVRAACHEVWGVGVVDLYSSQEVGYIALQCPEHDHYHVQSEAAYVEVLDEKGRPCGPGETGRVVVTALHNFVMPLLRYDLGDYAVVGGPCPCGRGLPVLARVVGRVRNMFVLPSGERFWPVFRSDRFLEAVPVRQYQVVQKSLDEVEVRLVMDRPLSAADEAAVRKVVHGEVGESFRVSLARVDEIPRGPGGKYEDVRSEVAG